MEKQTSYDVNIPLCVVTSCTLIRIQTCSILIGYRTSFVAGFWLVGKSWMGNNWV